MPVRIRLQRHGKKGNPFYWIVVADSRAKRDGRYLEKIGIYNPNTNPATVDLDIDEAVKWLGNGAQPSDTARTLLSYRGAMMKHHLNGGVKKGAFSQEEADNRFKTWLEEKQNKIQAKTDELSKVLAIDLEHRLEAEKAVNQKRIIDMTADSEQDAAVETLTEEVPVTEVTDEAVATKANVNQEEATELDASVEEAKSLQAPVEETKSEEPPVKEIKAKEVLAEEETKSEEASAKEDESKE